MEGEREGIEGGEDVWGGEKVEVSGWSREGRKL